jgi:hypothetical protein
LSFVASTPEQSEKNPGAKDKQGERNWFRKFEWNDVRHLNAENQS